MVIKMCLDKDFTELIYSTLKLLAVNKYRNSEKLTHRYSLLLLLVPVMVLLVQVESRSSAGEERAIAERETCVYTWNTEERPSRPTTCFAAESEARVSSSRRSRTTCQTSRRTGWPQSGRIARADETCSVRTTSAPQMAEAKESEWRRRRRHWPPSEAEATRRAMERCT